MRGLQKNPWHVSYATPVGFLTALIVLGCHFEASASSISSSEISSYRHTYYLSIIWILFNKLVSLSIDSSDSLGDYF